jgi:hypothetical protein
MNMLDNFLNIISITASLFRKYTEWIHTALHYGHQARVQDIRRHSRRGKTQQNDQERSRNNHRIIGAADIWDEGKDREQRYERAHV